MIHAHRTVTAPPLGKVSRAPAVLVLSSTLMLALFYYFVRADTIGVFSADRGWTVMTSGPLAAPMHFLAAALLLGVAPAIIARHFLRVGFVQLGLGLGDWRRGLAVLAIGAPIAMLAGWVGSRSPAMRAVYPLDTNLTPESFLTYAPLAFLYFAAWEVLFRGVLLFGLSRHLGEAAGNGTQTALSVAAHFGRAVTETFAALPAGWVFGRLALRLGSVWFIALLHWLVCMSMELFIVLGS